MLLGDVLPHPPRQCSFRPFLAARRASFHSARSRSIHAVRTLAILIGDAVPHPPGERGQRFVLAANCARLHALPPSFLLAFFGGAPLNA
eukprot:949368-Pyramimonas_sp.AAC.1